MPPGGYFWPVSEKVKLEAPTWELLRDAVVAWRMRNGQPPGDFERDYNQWLCAKWPAFCVFEAGDQIPRPAATPRVEDGLNHRVSMWAARQGQILTPGGANLVAPTMAEMRAAVCIQCPRNKNWKTGCGACSATAESILKSVRRLSKTSLDDRLLGCEVGGFELKTAVWLADMKPTEAERGISPPGCWRLSL